MDDVIRYEQWKYLPVEDILKLCSTSKRMKEICDDQYTWKYLLLRDYNISVPQTGDYQIEYMVEKSKEKLWNKYEPLIMAINKSMNKQFDDQYAINVATGRIVTAKSNLYNYRRYDVRPLDGQNWRHIIFAFPKRLSPDDGKIYHRILSLIFEGYIL
jgi:hypothetical protein